MYTNQKIAKKVFGNSNKVRCCVPEKEILKISSSFKHNKRYLENSAIRTPFWIRFSEQQFVHKKARRTVKSIIYSSECHHPQKYGKKPEKFMPKNK